MTDETARIIQRLDGQEKALRDVIDVVDAVVKALESDRSGSWDVRGLRSILGEVKNSLSRGGRL